MTDRLEAAVRNGKQAAILLDDPLLNEALELLEKHAIEAMLMATDEGDLIWKCADVKAIRRFRQCLRAYLDNGKIAAVTLKSN